MKLMLPNFKFVVEKWKWNKEFGVYVSTQGRFKNKYKQLIPYKTTESGYLGVATKHGYRLAHRLVLMTWKPIEDRENFTVDHLNHNKRDNSVENLEWVTSIENQVRAKKDFLSNAEMIKETLNKAENIAGEIIARKGDNSHRKTFSSIEEAFVFVRSLQPSSGHNAPIKSNLEKAIINKGSYCGYKWEVK